jgi:hypothetical protein
VAIKKNSKTKLKNIHLTSVDLCQQGANPDANITLYKSAPQEEESPVKRAWSMLKNTFSNGGIQKDAQTFGDVESTQEQRRAFYQYQDAFYTSIQSILEDDEQDGPAKRDLLLQSLSEYTDAMSGWIGTMFSGESLEKNDKGDNDMNDENMDLSALSEDEQKTFKGLLGKVKPAAKKEPAKKSASQIPSEQTPPASEPTSTPTTATAPAAAPASVQTPVPAAVPEGTSSDPAVQKAIDRMNALSERMEKSLQQQEEGAMQEVAKKYALLGEKSEDLVKTLCAMKTAGPTAYDAYVGALDKALAAVQKSDSGLFNEIGKSSHQYEAATGSVQKAQEIAKSIRSEHPELTPQQAMVRAFEEHPELETEYEQDYEGGRA